MATDWRNFRGVSYVTGPRGQGNSNFCWGFASTALIETQSRIDHAAWCVRSEGDLFATLGMYHFKGGDPGTALNQIDTVGIADPDCLQWFDGETNYVSTSSSSPDRDGRTVRRCYWVATSDVAQQKIWLDTRGPLVCDMVVFDDFFAFYDGGSGVYTPRANQTPTGTHLMLVVGYDDSQGCWLIKNSWGATRAHPDAVCRIAYGSGQIDTNAKYAAYHLDVDPVTRRRHHSGGLVVTGGGMARRALELVVNFNGKLYHYESQGGGRWSLVNTFGQNVYIRGALDSDVSVTQTSYDRNIEVMARYAPSGAQGALQHWVFRQKSRDWQPAAPNGVGPANSAGTPAFIQTNVGQPGRFAIVTRNTARQLVCFERNNARPWTGDPLGRWRQVGPAFGANVISGPAVVQARAGSWPEGEMGRGDLHVACITSTAGTSGSIEHWSRTAAGQWIRRATFANGASGALQMIESVRGGTEWTTGWLELFVLIDGNVEHWRNPAPDAANAFWYPVLRFGNDTGGAVVDVLGVAQGDKGVFGYDIILRRANGVLEHWVEFEYPSSNPGARRVGYLP